MLETRWVPRSNTSPSGSRKQQHALGLWDVFRCETVSLVYTFQKLKSITSPLLSPVFPPHPQRLDGAGTEARMTSTWTQENETLVPIWARTFISLFIIFYRAAAAVRGSVMEPHAWMTSLIYLCRGPSLICVQRATRREPLYWSQQSVSLCSQRWCHLMVPKAREALFCVTEVVPRTLWAAFSIRRPKPRWFGLSVDIWSAARENGSTPLWPGRYFKLATRGRWENETRRT